MNDLRDKVKANLTVSDFNGSLETFSSQSSLTSDISSKDDIDGTNEQVS